MKEKLGDENPRRRRLGHATNYQKNGKREVQAKKYKMLDGRGLSLLVLPTGMKLWLWRYPYNGIEKNMTFGDVPHVGPKDARELHFAAKKLLAAGVNPIADRKAEAAAKQQRLYSVKLITALKRSPESGARGGRSVGRQGTQRP